MQVRQEDANLEVIEKLEKNKDKEKFVDMNRFECPICLETFQACTETSCGHLFCGRCILESRNNQQEKIICPVCKRLVSMLIPLYSVRNELAVHDHVDPGQIDLHIEEYNLKFALNQRTTSDTMRENLMLLRRMFRHSWFNKALLAITFSLVLLYVLVPNDLIPDTSVVGYIDDFIICVLGFWFVFYAVEWYRERLLLQNHPKKTE
eukprot:TRINITY_DN3243_c0_g1_i2.p1 TRINITY_DN3243_c0_g1~~TRINITY_DN3243_c0_g1_i2.p1  ORF type:complete len:206 (+),score=13.56 TRINITY_DN3243_c0_g1_i2:47-664(+)